MTVDKIIKSIDLIIEEIENDNRNIEDIISELLTREEAINMQLAVIKTLLLISE